MELSVLEFRINDFLNLKLEESKTFIYVGEEVFRSCQIVVFNIPIRNITELETYESIDEILNFYEKEITLQNGNEAKLISPIEEFWVHCSGIHIWAENNYDTTLLDSYLAFPLLKKLVEKGDTVAKVVFKEEIAKKLNCRVPQVLRYLLLEKYDSYLSNEEIIFAVLNSKEALALKSVSIKVHKQYNLVFNFDDLRHKFFNIHRGKSEIQNNKYYFSIFNGKLEELEFVLDSNCINLPHEINKFTTINRLYLYFDNTDNSIQDFNILLESLSHLKIFCYGKVKIPNISHAFPNIELVEIYSDTPSQVIVDDEELTKTIITKM